MEWQETPEADTAYVEDSPEKGYFLALTVCGENGKEFSYSIAVCIGEAAEEGETIYGDEIASIGGTTLSRESAKRIAEYIATHEVAMFTL